MRIVWLSAEVVTPRSAARSKRGLMVISGCARLLPTRGATSPGMVAISVANQIAKEMATIPGLVAPRVGSNLAQPEITIKPRFDLAADLGVTTAALSQTVRIATLGEIEQNSAKFSLSDRQVPITVSLSENSRRDLSTLENLPVPTTKGGSVPLKAVADIGFGSSPTTIQRSNQ